MIAEISTGFLNPFLNLKVTLGPHKPLYDFVLLKTSQFSNGDMLIGAEL